MVKGHASRIILVFPYAYDTYSVKTGCPSLFIAYYVYSIVAMMGRSTLRLKKKNMSFLNGWLVVFSPTPLKHMRVRQLG